MKPALALAASLSLVACSSTGGDSSCDEAQTLLDLTFAAGAGPGYGAPELDGWCDGATFVVESNGIPHYTFVEITPNALTEADQRWEIPLNPAVAPAPTDIPLLGDVGFTVAGTVWYGPNEAERPDPYGDPVHNGITDGCTGHTAPQAYHHHALQQECLVQENVGKAEPWTAGDPDPNVASPVIGWAGDGFPIHGPYGCADPACSAVVEYVSGWEQIGDPSTYAWDAHEYRASADATVLDQCNGHVGPGGDYHYHATSTFPYILGCFTGTPAADFR